MLMAKIQKADLLAFVYLKQKGETFLSFFNVDRRAY